MKGGADHLSSRTIGHSRFQVPPPALPPTGCRRCHSPRPRPSPWRRSRGKSGGHGGGLVSRLRAELEVSPHTSASLPRGWSCGTAGLGHRLPAASFSFSGLPVCLPPDAAQVRKPSARLRGGAVQERRLGAAGAGGLRRGRLLGLRCAAWRARGLAGLWSAVGEEALRWDPGAGAEARFSGRGDSRGEGEVCWGSWGSSGFEWGWVAAKRVPGVRGRERFVRS